MTQLNYETCAVRPRIDLSEWDILSSMPIALIILNAQGDIVWLNPEAETMLGYGLIGSAWKDVIQKAFIPREDDGHEVSLADGRKVHVAISSLNSLPGILVTLSDITASRNYEQAKEHDNRLLSIGTMTAQLAHQIRTPLASAMLYTDHISHYAGLDERAMTWVKRLEDCHTSIEQQIQDLLLFARGTSIEPKHTSMQQWCDELSERAEPHLESSKVKLQINNHLLHDDALMHSESMIGSILNLIINAMQAEANEIQITLASMDHKGLQISVEDNGKGMSTEVKKQAFSPFYTTKARGTGLGLPVVFAVVKAHGGTVAIESEVDVGTQVHLYLPGDSSRA